MRQKKSGVNFVDLGCGSGKAVMVAAIDPIHKFEQVIGIEIVSDLYDIAEQIKLRFEDTIENIENEPESKKKRTNTKKVNNNMNEKARGF